MKFKYQKLSNWTMFTGNKWRVVSFPSKPCFLAEVSHIMVGWAGGQKISYIFCIQIIFTHYCCHFMLIFFKLVGSLCLSRFLSFIKRKRYPWKWFQLYCISVVLLLYLLCGCLSSNWIWRVCERLSSILGLNSPLGYLYGCCCNNKPAL